MAEMVKIDLEDLFDGGAQVINVQKCDDCPFLYDSAWCDMEDDRQIPFTDEPKHNPWPAWCPLRDRAVIVVVDDTLT